MYPQSADWLPTQSFLVGIWKDINEQNVQDVVLKNISDPLFASILLCATVAFLCWLLSVITGNSSQVDRIWSLIPAVYIGIFAWKDISLIIKGNFDLADKRLLIMTLLSSMWGLRLTYNFWRKGGYNMKDEDYRWPVLRKIIHPFFYQIFNITFIATYQNILLLLITIPTYIVYLGRGKVPLSEMDYAATGLFITFLLGETIADQQQWNFQTAKYAKKNTNQKLTGDYALGFLTHGLFRFSRHPNFFCEISLWWSIYLFSVSVSGVWFNWTIIGAVLLTLLFQGSTAFTEWITAKKYPDYKTYQKTTSRLIPWLPGQPVVAKKD